MIEATQLRVASYFLSAVFFCTSFKKIKTALINSYFSEKQRYINENCIYISENRDISMKTALISPKKISIPID